MKNVQVEETFYLIFVASVARSRTVGGSHRRLPWSWHVEGRPASLCLGSSPCAASGVRRVILASSLQGRWSPGSRGYTQLPQDSSHVTWRPLWSWERAVCAFFCTHRFPVYTRISHSVVRTVEMCEMIWAITQTDILKYLHVSFNVY